jgi:hypothetical protein
LPPDLRHHFTKGQRAVLCIVAGEVKQKSFCDMPLDKMAALAGYAAPQCKPRCMRRVGCFRSGSPNARGLAAKA